LFVARHYSFIVMDLHHLLLAGLPGALSSAPESGLKSDITSCLDVPQPAFARHLMCRHQNPRKPKWQIEIPLNYRLDCIRRGATMTKREHKQNGSNNEQNGAGGRPKSWLAANSAFVLSTIAILALASTQLVTIGENFPKIFPFWAPFNANISVRDIRVQKAEAVQNRTGDAAPETAVKVEVEYVEEDGALHTQTLPAGNAIAGCLQVNEPASGH
jgi:hypothetical protein